MTAVLYRFRAELRRRGTAWIGVGVVIGLAGGLVLALFAGARRTESAYDRFLVAQNSYDVLLVSGIPGLFDFAPLDFDTVEDLPEVTDAAHLRVLGYAGRTADGTLISAENVNLAADPSGRFGVDVNRFKVLDGRLADPTQRGEIVVGFPTAELLSLSVGDRLFVNVFDGDEATSVFGGQVSLEEAAGTGPLEELEVVGIVAVPGDFPPRGDPTVDIEFGYLTPALMDAYPDAQAVEALAVKVEGGTDAVGAFLAKLQAQSGDLPVVGSPASQQAVSVRGALGTLRGALLVAGVLAAIVAALVLVQVLARQAFLEGEDAPTLDALGFGRLEHRRLGLLKGLVIGGVAACTAATSAALLSPLFPIGLAKTAEPHPGFDVDAPVVLGGVAGVLVACVAVAVVAAWIGERARHTMVVRVAPPQRRQTFFRWAGGAAPGPVTRAATSLVSGQRGVGGAVAGIALGLVTVLGMLTFSASLQHLRSTPALYGWTWDVLVGGDFGEPLLPEGIEELASDADVHGMQVGALVDVEIAGRPLRALAVEPVTGEVRPAVLDGRHPLGPDEIALASDVAPDIDIGQRVPLALGGRTVDVELVGRVALPEIDVLADFGAVQRLSPDTTPQLAVIDVTTGTNARAFALEATETLGLSGGNAAYPELPQDVANFGRADATPAVIGILMALVAAATLFHALLTAVQRERRTHALLRTLGFTARQLLATVAWQAAILVTIAFLIALPLGVTAGRFLWLAFADQLSVVPKAVVPFGAFALTAAAALAIGLVVSMFPGWRAGRIAPAGALRGE